MSQRNILTLQLTAVVVLALAAVACGSGDSSYDAADAVDAVKSVAAEPVSEVMVAAKLAGADLVDGEKDHVVSRCPGCALAMAGSADYALEVQDYELHFCSDSCRDGFKDDAMTKIAQLEIPAP